jgi:hypothetical protein
LLIVQEFNWLAPTVGQRELTVPLNIIQPVIKSIRVPNWVHMTTGIDGESPHNKTTDKINAPANPQPGAVLTRRWWSETNYSKFTQGDLNEN